MNDSQHKETVILLHGILNRPFVLGLLAGALQRAGYEVHNWGYPSRDKVIPDHAAELDRFVAMLGPRERIHFVGFSMGAIIIRYYLAHFALPNAGRFVMIGPPNHGSEKADRMYRYKWFKWIYKDKSIEQLLSTNKAFFQECGIPPVDFGIIAGGRGTPAGYARGFPGDNDGAVSVESARLDGAKDFILLKYDHTFMIFAPATAVQTIHFLKHGRFDQ